MIRRSLLRLAALLTAASFLGVSHAMPASQGSASNCATGKTFGAWTLPVPGDPGALNGVLADDGRARFHVRAMVVPDGPPSAGGPRRGELRGTLEILTPNGPRPFARVSGTWVGNAQGQGRFQAKVFRSGPGPGLPVLLIGEIEGRFDDSDPNAAPGSYRGRWKICH